MKFRNRWFDLTCLAAVLVTVLVACPGGSTTTADTTKPTVSLGTSSTNITTAGNLTLTATASDNVAVTKVEFFDGANKLGEDSSAGDGFTQAVTLASSNNGQKSYTAKAFDAAGNTQISAALVVTVAIPVVPVDSTRPTLKSSKALSSTSMELVFSEAIVSEAPVGGDVADNFGLLFCDVTVSTTCVTFTVTEASISSDGTTVTLTTILQKPNEQYLLNIIEANVKDLAGNEFNTAGSSPFLFTIFGFNPVP